LIPWKTAISWSSLRRGWQPGFDRGMMILVSLFLTAVALVVIGLGLAWTWRLGPQQYWLRQTAVSWHWMLGLGLLAPFVLHVWRRWPRPKRVDFTSRRAALKMIGLGGATLVGWWAAEALHRWRSEPEAPRRATGSRRAGLFSGNRFPVTHNLAASEAQVDPAVWRLELEGERTGRLQLSYEDLRDLPQSEMTATIDCTLGWYATQKWEGIWLKDLLRVGDAPGQAIAVRFESVTGYAQTLPWEEALGVLLATHVDGETLSHSHGFPVRVVAPLRRGWFWVKWLAKVEVLL
jgi:DMSO/TMAO reductase YedYZ molybdopterin-dependent catalytic subunit